MRTSIEIPDKQLKELMSICKTEKISRTELIQRAISLYLQKKNLQQQLRHLVSGRNTK